MKKEPSNHYFKGLSRQEYIQKAHDIIQEEGIEAVSIRRIAKELGCSSASLYRYFDDLSELLYFAELRMLRGYIRRMNEMAPKWKNVWEVYVGVWECYSQEAFTHPEAYNRLFFDYPTEKLGSSIKEYYQMFSEDILETNQIFEDMLQTSNFMRRDFEMCKQCVRENTITYENAVKLNRMACMLYKGYLKTALDEDLNEEQVRENVRAFVTDVDMLVENLADELMGYEGYYVRKTM